MRFLSVCILLLVVANFLIYQSILAPKVLEVTVFEAGKGTAILVHTPEEKTLLINTGSDASILRALGTALPEWDRRIDSVVITGSTSNYSGGLQDVTNRYRVSNITHFGNETPYGTILTFDDVYVEVFSPDLLNISYSASLLKISSTTPKGIYTSDGTTFIKTK